MGGPHQTQKLLYHPLVLGKQLFVASSWSSVFVTSLCLQGCRQRRGLFGKHTTISSDDTFQMTRKYPTYHSSSYSGSDIETVKKKKKNLLLKCADERGVSAFCTSSNVPEEKGVCSRDQRYCILLQLTTQRAAPRRNLTLPACKLLNPSGTCMVSHGFVWMAFDCPMWVCFHGFGFPCMSLPHWCILTRLHCAQ